MVSQAQPRTKKKPESFSRRDWIVIIVFSGAFSLAGLGCVAFGIFSLQRAWASKSWPTTPGMVQSAEVERRWEHKEQEPSHWIYYAAIRYDFQVGGKPYSGNKVSYGDYGSGNSSHAQALVAQYAKGKPVTVHYLAAKPQICVLEPGASAHIWIPMIVGIVFMAIGVLVGSLPFYARKLTAAKAKLRNA